MDIFKDLRSKNNNYSEKIEVNKFTQSISEKKVLPVKESSKKYDNDVVKTFKTIFELILSIKDVNYTLLEFQELHKYISDKKLELCSIVDTEYPTYNFNKRMLSKSLICKNLQQINDNNLSSLLFYNEHFKINLIIYNKSDNKYYKTGLKNYEKIYITYHNKKWTILDINNNDINYSDINELNTIIDIDLKNNIIYEPYLKAFSHYKLPDLIEIAEEYSMNILKENGKKKSKRELYDEINLYKL
uniref:Uncharacterized protein n=1 Tax=viral metagenome TaxID=1070528 RepID=A0A6C0C4E5_9ZZZZ